MYRSAVLSTHLPVDGFPIGQHPLVSRLLKGVFKSRSPQSKYNGVWDVSRILDYIRSLGGNDALSVPLLTKKIAILLTLASAQISSDLVRLSLPVSKTSNGVSIPLHGLAKQSQPGKSRGMEPLYISEFTQDASLCPVKCLNEYVARTQIWRKQQSQLLLAITAPHRAVTSSFIARWLEDIHVSQRTQPGVHQHLLQHYQA